MGDYMASPFHNRDQSTVSQVDCKAFVKVGYHQYSEMLMAYHLLFILKKWNYKQLLLRSVIKAFKRKNRENTDNKKKVLFHQDNDTNQWKRWLNLKDCVLNCFRIHCALQIDYTKKNMMITEHFLLTTLELFSQN